VFKQTDKKYPSRVKMTKIYLAVFLNTHFRLLGALFHTSSLKNSGEWSLEYMKLCGLPEEERTR
jgi:hypothetical protein